MKHSISILALLPSLLFAAIWDGTTDTTWYTDNKDAIEYTISTAEELAGLAMLVNDFSETDGNSTYNMEGVTIKLGNDIALNDTADWQNWNEETTGLTQWTAIGKSDFYCIGFQGTFDGDGHVISGVYINSTSNYKGLFGCNSGIVKNLGVVASYTKGSSLVERNNGTISNSYATGNVEEGGGLVRYNYGGTIINSYATGNVSGQGTLGGLVAGNDGSINNSYATGNVEGTGSQVGGLAGYNGGTIINSYATGNVEGTSHVGGLAGNIISSGSTITNSYATGNTKGIDYVGGLAGNSYGTISNSYATGNVEGTGSYVGGLAGQNLRGTIINSYATGNVSGSNEAGGLAGSNNYGTITNSYAIGNVSGSSNVGGLAGYSTNGTITNSYATGNVKGTSYTGGLVGQNGYNDASNTTIITNSYYNIETSGQSDALKGERKTTEQMQSKSNYTGWDFNGIWDIDGKFNNGMPYFQWKNTMRQVRVESIESQLYTGKQIKPMPKVTTPDGKTELMPEIDFDFFYDENIHIASGGTVYIVAKTDGAYYGTKIVSFIIKPSRTVNVYWYPECGTIDNIYTYNGKPQGPIPYTDEYDVTAELETNAGGSLSANATLVNSEDDVVLQNASCAYTINPKTLAVTWTTDSVFTYNKMMQAPVPSVSDTSVKLLRRNAHAAASIYKDENAASAEIEDQEQARNYILTNRTKNYEILKKDLNPYFAATLPDFSTNEADTLWVPYEVFKDSAALHSVLSGLIDYNGFAADTIKNESDDASVLRGNPTIVLRYAQTSPAMLSKRVETTQKATATIVTDSISADNYTLTRQIIVIMATVEEDENADKVFCRLGNNCARFSAEVCSAISGEIIESCEIKVACVINGTCVKDFSLETCSAMSGEAVLSCEESPILRPQFSGGAFRAWQTASGVVNVDLGYMPSAPVTLDVYDLKGKLIATEQVNARFSSVKVNTSSGIYLFKIGNINKKVLIY